MLSDDIVIADLNPAPRLRLESDILGRSADDRAVTDGILLSNRHGAFDHDVRLDDGFVPDDGFRSNESERSNLDSDAE
jgi:hypothetical protein